MQSGQRLNIGDMSSVRRIDLNCNWGRGARDSRARAEETDLERIWEEVLYYTEGEGKNNDQESLNGAHQAKEKAAGRNMCESQVQDEALHHHGNTQ